jgi:hypothetical protein
MNETQAKKERLNFGKEMAARPPLSKTSPMSLTLVLKVLWTFSFFGHFKMAMK